MKIDSKVYDEREPLLKVLPGRKKKRNNIFPFLGENVSFMSEGEMDAKASLVFRAVIINVPRI